MIYLASPYSHPDRSMRILRHKIAESYTAHCIGKGEHLFSPIVYAHAMADSNSIPLDAKFWQAFNNEMLIRASSMRVLQLKGWDDSLGIRQEMLFAKSIGLPLEFVNWPE